MMLVELSTFPQLFSLYLFTCIFCFENEVEGMFFLGLLCLFFALKTFFPCDFTFCDIFRPVLASVIPVVFRDHVQHLST